MTHAELLELGCPAALLDAVSSFEALAIERIPPKDFFAGSTHADMIYELLDDTFVVVAVGSCFDRADILLNQARELAAAIIVERHPEAFRAWARRPRESIS